MRGALSKSSVWEPRMCDVFGRVVGFAALRNLARPGMKGYTAMSDSTPRTIRQLTEDEAIQMNKVIQEVQPIPEMLAAGKYLEVMAMWPAVEQHLTEALRMVGFAERLLANDAVFKIHLLKAWVQAQWQLTPDDGTGTRPVAGFPLLPKQGATPSA